MAYNKNLAGISCDFSSFQTNMGFFLPTGSFRFAHSIVSNTFALQNIHTFQNILEIEDCLDFHPFLPCRQVESVKSNTLLIKIKIKAIRVKFFFQKVVRGQVSCPGGQGCLCLGHVCPALPSW